MATPGAPVCKICQSPTSDAGRKYGRFRRRWFHLRHCHACGFSFVADPWTDYASIYSEQYYEGRGADPSVDYLFELEHPDQTIRTFEWQGIVAAVNALSESGAAARWLDFGCGNGGLVQYCRTRGYGNVVGFEEGAIRDRAAKRGIPLVGSDELQQWDGTCDVVTAIEVLEHVEEPLPVLRRIRRLLKPGGLFFLTTGNAKRYRGNLARWSSVLPEVHISFYEPGTLAIALSKTGFQPAFPGYVTGFTDILRFKILKALGARRHSAVHRLLPWDVACRAADLIYGASQQPVGRAITVPDSALV